MTKEIYIPIEIKNRDLKPRLLVLYFLIKKGYKCVIGDKTGVYRYMINNPKGIYYDKSISINKLSFMKKIKKIASNIVCSDEELSVTYNKNNINYFFKFRSALSTLKETTHYYCCGKRDYNYLLNKYPNHKDKFKLTGSAQFDFIKEKFSKLIYEKKIEEIKLKYGDFILFNSSFGIISESDIYYQAKLAVKLERIDKNEYEEKVIELKKRYNDFLEFVKILNKLSSKFPDLIFIIRPHPKENMKFWVKNLVNRKNVKVVKENEVIPWIYACKLLIHKRCTTSIFAHLLKKKIISYIPKSNVVDVANHTENIGTQATNYIEIKNLISVFKKAKIDANPLIKDILEISKINFAAKSIADEITSIDKIQEEIYFFDYIYFKLLIVKNFFARKRDKYLGKNKNMEKKLGAIKKIEIHDFLNSVSTYFSNEFKFNVNNVYNNTFEIYRED